MDFELWYLVLVPVLFAAGWWARGFDAREREEQSRQLPEAYSRGVAMLMSDHPEKAIDPFIEVVRLDPELIELHHVLGVLFRRRGEFERAIKLHNHLVNREDIPDADRVKAQRELAEDYLTAGLFGRAEEAYKKLCEDPTEHLTALKALLRIYCIEHEWTSAIDVAGQIQAQAGEDRTEDIAHYYCELADNAMRRKDLELANEYIQKALEVKPELPRPNITAGDIAAAAGDLQKALERWRFVMKKTPDYTALVIGRIADALDKLGRRSEALALLHEALAGSESIDLMEAAVTRIAQWQGSADAQHTVEAILSRHPTLSGFSLLSTLREKEHPESGEDKLLASLLQRHSRRLARYQCRKCGFLASSFVWHCLACGSWDSFPPRRLEDSK
jgi:lipopolysaccharide biosynthesis regulator YciM